METRYLARPTPPPAQQGTCGTRSQQNSIWSYPTADIGPALQADEPVAQAELLPQCPSPHTGLTTCLAPGSPISLPPLCLPYFNTSCTHSSAMSLLTLKELLLLGLEVVQAT